MIASRKKNLCRKDLSRVETAPLPNLVQKFFFPKLNSFPHKQNFLSKMEKVNSWSELVDEWTQTMKHLQEEKVISPNYSDNKSMIAKSKKFASRDEELQLMAYFADKQSDLFAKLAKKTKKKNPDLALELAEKSVRLAFWAFDLKKQQNPQT